MSTVTTVICLTVVPKIIKYIVMLLGRITYFWWNRKTSGEKQKFKERVKNYHNTIWYTGGAGVGLFTGFLLYQTARNPVTGRWQLFLFNDLVMAQLANYDVDQMLATYKMFNMLLDTTHPKYIRVANLTGKLLNANQNMDIIKNQRWSIVVVDNPEINAFVMSNGFIFVYTGIENRANDDQLTIVIGHELTHCTNKHLNQKWSIQFVANVLYLVPVAVIWTVLPFFRAVCVHILSEIAKKLLLILPFERAQEVEADRDGLMLAAKTCIDVTEGYKFWMKMAKNDEKSQIKYKWPVWVSTHPSNMSRAQHLYSLIPEAQELQRVQNCGNTRNSLGK